MFDKSMSDRHHGSERHTPPSAKPCGGQPPGGKSHETTWREWLHCEATARIPPRIKDSFETWHYVSISGDRALNATVAWVERWGCSIAIASLLLGGPSALLCASPKGNPPTGQSARELVKDVTRKEQVARKNPQNYYKFIQVEKSSEGTKTSIRIETPSGEIGEVVSVNGKPPSPAQCLKDTDSLKKLASDPKLQQRQARELKQQSDRIDRLMTAIPDAFIFKYEENQPSGNWIVVGFHPNPAFQPQSHEASLLKGMRGTLWVDRASHRLAKIDGTLFKDVNFGWGFLASLHKGGHFAMQQSVVPGGSWKQTFLQVDLDGSKLVLGQLHVHFTDVSRSFVKLADAGTLAGAVTMLQHGPTACNGSSDTGITAQAEVH